MIEYIVFVETSSYVLNIAIFMIKLQNVLKLNLEAWAPGLSGI